MRYEFSNTAPGNQHFKSSCGNTAWIYHLHNSGAQTQLLPVCIAGQTLSYIHTHSYAHTVDMHSMYTRTGDTEEVSR